MFTIKLDSEQLLYVIKTIQRDVHIKTIASQFHRPCPVEEIPEDLLTDSEKDLLIGKELLEAWTSTEEYDI